MIFMVIYLFPVLAALGLGLLAGWNDFKGMIIPNYIVVFVFAAFWLSFGADYMAGTGIFSSLKSHLIAGGVVLIVTFVMFSMKLIGGGDSKLIASFSFWFGMGGLPVFLFYMMVSGSLLGCAALLLKKKPLFKSPPDGSWVARVQGGESVVPYGIPIAIGAVVAFFSLGFLAPENLKLFLVPN